MVCKNVVITSCGTEAQLAWPVKMEGTGQTGLEPGIWGVHTGDPGGCERGGGGPLPCHTRSASLPSLCAAQSEEQTGEGGLEVWTPECELELVWQQIRMSVRLRVVCEWAAYPLLHSLLASACSHRSSEVDGHQRVRRQKEVVKSQGVLGLRQHMAKPRNEPGQGKDGPHLRPEAQTYTNRGVQENNSRTEVYLNFSHKWFQEEITCGHCDEQCCQVWKFISQWGRVWKRHLGDH